MTAGKIFTQLAEALRVPEKVRRLFIIAASRRVVLPDFGIFPALEELSLLGNLAHVTTFPAVLGCTRLRRLTVGGTSVTELGPGLARLEQLESLALVGHRRLTALPEDLVELTHLRHLRVDHNRLERLPSRIGALQNLEELVAYNNALRALPASLLHLKKLRWLELQGNALRARPLGLLKLRTVRHLVTDFEDVCLPPRKQPRP